MEAAQPIDVHSNRIRNTLIILIGVLLLFTVPTQAASKHRAPTKKSSKITRENLEGSFRKFCDEWMQKVWARAESKDWVQQGDDVTRTYVEYSRDYTCELMNEKPPVGKINYRENWYEQHGKTRDEAEASERTPVKILETGELFSWNRGKWDF